MPATWQTLYYYLRISNVMIFSLIVGSLDIDLYGRIRFYDLKE